jgi:hypothetical protein
MIRVLRYLSAALLLAWLTGLGLVFYVSTVTKLTLHGSNGSWGESELESQILQMVVTTVVGAAALLSVSLYASFKDNQKWHRVFWVPLLSIPITWTVSYSASVVWRSTFSLARAHFCSETFRNTHPSPQMCRLCTPDQCGG